MEAHQNLSTAFGATAEGGAPLTIVESVERLGQTVRLLQKERLCYTSALQDLYVDGCWQTTQLALHALLLFGVQTVTAIPGFQIVASGSTTAWKERCRLPPYTNAWGEPLPGVVSERAQKRSKGNLLKETHIRPFVKPFCETS
jgi:hypothetical protein